MRRKFRWTTNGCFRWRLKNALLKMPQCLAELLGYCRLTVFISTGLFWLFPPWTVVVVLVHLDGALAFSLRYFVFTCFVQHGLLRADAVRLLLQVVAEPQHHRL